LCNVANTIFVPSCQILSQKPAKTSCVLNITPEPTEYHAGGIESVWEQCTVGSGCSAQWASQHPVCTWHVHVCQCMNQLLQHGIMPVAYIAKLQPAERRPVTLPGGGREYVCCRSICLLSAAENVVYGYMSNAAH
jgi:hypothetical protein